MARTRTRLLAAVAAAAAMSLGAAPALAMSALKGKQASGAQTSDYSATRNAYFGDLHIHTRYSFDAFIFNVRVTPDDAYAYARGEPIAHSSGKSVRLITSPLDFVAVTDHAEYLGVLPAMADASSPLSQLELARSMFGQTREERRAAFNTVGADIVAGKRQTDLADTAVSRTAWDEILASAERNYEPGHLTTFAAYEFTSAPNGQNLHRNVVFRGKAPEMPFTAFESQNPEDLWHWLDALREQGVEGLAIPHNSNGSDGIMFERTTYGDAPIDRAYSELRMRNEPIAEITQVKGTSETHPLLSPNDEWAGFELFEKRIGSDTPITKFDGGYVRDALKAGLELGAAGEGNPYHMGFIGSTDTHNAGGPIDEQAYFGKIGAVDGSPEGRGAVMVHAKGQPAPDPKTLVSYAQWSASGVAGVWAEENTREAIYDALRRKETFATSGPRMRVRFFAGHGFDASLLTDPEAIETAYRMGVPMGGDLEPASEPPTFFVWAMRDPASGWLQRVQIVKGWLENGKAQEKVIDVACSDGLTPDPATGRCPDNGAAVDLKTCAVSKDKGASELKAVWQDPNFDARASAFYYVRVLEDPSCRWSTWEALRLGVKVHPKLPKTIQERAWTSPIWYVPEG